MRSRHSGQIAIEIVAETSKKKRGRETETEKWVRRGVQREYRVMSLFNSTTTARTTTIVASLFFRGGKVASKGSCETMQRLSRNHKQLLCSAALPLLCLCLCQCCLLLLPLLQPLTCNTRNCSCCLRIWCRAACAKCKCRRKINKLIN